MARQKKQQPFEYDLDEKPAAPAAPVVVVDACPTFTLRADTPGHLHALISLAALPRSPIWDTIREFELWEEAHPCR